MENVFIQFALVLSAASLFGFIAYRFKLPLVVAYLLSGVLISFLGVFANVTAEHGSIFGFLPEIGIALVLFLIGMELDLREIKSLGKPILLASFVQIVLSTLAGATIAKYLGFNPTESFYLGIGLSFSSTVVVIKLLIEKRDLASLYGKLSIGILLLEDLIAIAVLMGISVGSSVFKLGLQESTPLFALLIKAVLLFVLTFVLSKYILERFFRVAARSTELLFLTALTWCFVFIALSQLAGFSIEIGAFLAGVALASSAYRLQIESKIKPLRDFFVTLFFIYLGTQAKFQDILPHLPIVLIFVAYALLIKPILFLATLGIFGFRKHTMFQTASSLSSISEFSLVILLVGVKQGFVSQGTLSVMAAATVISVIASSFAITYSQHFYKIFAPFIKFFEHKSKVHFLENDQRIDDISEHVVIIGAHRVGGPIVQFLQSKKIPFMVMDFNPHIVEDLRRAGITAVYGDIGDPEMLDALSLESAKLIISTATDLSDNEMLLAEAKRRKFKATIVVRAEDREHGKVLKKLGAEYVIIPETVSGDYLVDQLRHWPNIKFET